MKKNLPASKRITALLCSLFLFTAVFVSQVTAQVDTAFWFAVPYVNVHHGINIVKNKGDFFGGADPLYFKISTLDEDADVQITMPAHGDTVLFSEHISAGSTVTYTIPRELRFKIMQDRLGNKIEDKGIYIKSNALITVYYENATVQNPDLFSLKGKNALGKIFFTPFQTRWPNDPRHNTNFTSPLDQYWPYADGVPATYININKDLNTDGRVQLTNYDSIPGVYFTIDSAYSAFDIVATEDGTKVRITPTSAVVGHAAGVPYEITLNKGQTYSARAMSQGIKSSHIDSKDTYRSLSNYQAHKFCFVVESNRSENNLSGSKVEVVSGGKIAVTVRDDSVFENAEANSYSGSGEDYLGDQLVPIDFIGTEYIVITGQLLRKDVKEYCFIVATVDGTTISVNGIDQNVTLSAGQTYELLLNPDATSPVNNSIVTNKDVYVLQTTGFNLELAAAILPPIDICTGSYQVGFTRTYGGNGDQQDQTGRRFFMNVLVRKGTGAVNNKDGFTILTNGSEDPNATNKIRQANFVDVPGNSKWQAAKIEFSESELSNGAHILKNNMALFHMGLINATSYSFGQGYVLTGSEYGYFSNYNEAIPNAFIVQNGMQKKQAYYDVVKQEDIRLFAEGGISYDWNKFEKYNYLTSNWDDLNIVTQIKPSRTYYRPSITAPSDTGFYRIVVDIKNDCYPGIDTLLVRVIIGPKSNTDTVCTTVSGQCISDGYNLDNLNQFGHVLSKTQIASGMFIDGWYYRNQKSPYVLQNFEGISKVSTLVDYYNSTASEVNNPSIEAVNYSSKTMLLTKNASVGGGNTYKSAYATYKLQSSLNLIDGNMFSFRYMYGGTAISNSTQLNSFKVYAVLLNNSKVVDSVELNILASKIENPEWSLGEFYFKPTTGNVTHIRIGFYSDAPDPVSMYFDEIERTDPGTWDLITDANDHTLTQCINVVYAKVLNSNVSDYVDYAPQYVWVKEEGRKNHDIIVGPKCINENEPVCVSLVDYDEEVHDNILGEREWFTAIADTIDPSKAIDKSVPLCFISDTVFYALVRDQCHKVSELSFKITPIPRLNFTDTTIVLCADQVLDPSGKTKMVDLRSYESAYYQDPLTTYEITWYSDASRTQEVSNPSRVIVANSDILYGFVNAVGKIDCQTEVTMHFEVKEMPTFTFADTAYCEYITAQPFNVTPAGGIFTIDGVTVTDFKPSDYAGKTVDVVYSISDQSCPWLDTAVFTVKKAPVATIAPHDTLQYGVISITLDASVTNGSGDYDFTWSNVNSENSIVDTKVEDAVTRQMFDNDSFSLVVVDNITSCVDTASLSVVVKGRPLSIEIIVSPEPLCATRSQNLVAKIAGGVGGYSLAWSTGDVRDSSGVLLDTIVISPLVTTTYYVTVTDHGDRDSMLTASAVVTVYQNPVTSIVDTSICQNTPLSLDGSATGGNGTLTYVWSGADVALLSDPMISNPDFNSTADPNSYTYRYIVTDEKTCSDTADVTVNVLILPELGIAKDQVICSGHDLELNAATTSGTAPYKYNWTGDFAFLNSTTDETVIFNQTSLVPVTNVVSVKVTDANTCADSLDITVAVNTLPVPVISGINNGVCKNETISVSATPTGIGYTYSWKSEADVLGSSSVLTFDLTSIASDVPLKLIITDGATGCADSAMSLVTVHELPTVVISNAGGNEVCKNADLELEAEATSNPAGILSYTWTPVANISPSDARVVQFNSSVVGPTPVSVIVTDERECASTASDVVLVRDRPIYTKPAVSTICTTLDYDFNLNVASGDTVTWSGDLSVLKNNPADAKPRFYATEPGNYILNYVVSDGFCTSEDVVNLTVNLRPDVSVAGYEACQSVTRSIDAVLTAKTQSLDVTYKWTEGANSLSSTTSNLSYSSASLGGHSLQVIATATNQCSDTAVFSVTVNENPTATIVSDLSLASGNRVPYNADLTVSARASGGNPEYEYTWSSTANLTAEQVNALEITYPNFVSTSNVNYSLTVTDAKGCKATDTETYYTNDPCIKPLGDLNVCEGNRITVATSLCDFGDADKMQYTWYVNGVKQTWTGASEDFVPSAIAKKPLNTGDVLTIKVEVTNGSMVAPISKEFTIVVNPNPVPFLTVKTVGADDQLLKEFSFVSKVTSATSDDKLEYTWSGGLTDGIDSALKREPYLLNIVPAAIYDVNPSISLYVKDRHGCYATVSRGVNMIDIRATSICENGIATYKVFGVPSGATIHFVNEPLDWAKINDTTYTAYWPEGGMYPFTIYATHTDPLVLIVGDTVTQKVVAYPDVNIVGLADVCVGRTKPYEVISSEIGDISWSLGRIFESTNVLTTADTVYNAKVNVAWNRLGLDTLSVTVNNQGCPSSDFMFVNVHDNPIADFKYAPSDYIQIGTEVTFTNYSMGATPDADLSFYWDFVGDGIFTSETENPVYDYQDMGVFPVTLIAYDNKWGCLDTVVVPLTVSPNPNCSMEYPNTIIVNHSNPDARVFHSFDRVGVLEEGYIMKIFNQWGAIVWETTDINAKWDGYYNGSLVSQDVYSYQSNATCENGKILNKNGDVTVLR